MLERNGQYLKTFKGFIWTLITSFLCLLTKKVGGYIVILSFIFLIIFEIKNVKKLSLIVAALLVYLLVIEPKLFTPGGKQEKFSMFFQQTANYVKTYPEDVTENEKEILSKVLIYDKLSTDYNPVNADYVKGFSQRGEDEDYNNYTKVWIKQGLRHPDAYIKAFGAMISGAFSFTEYKPLTNMEHHSQLVKDFIDEKVTVRSERFQKTSDFINKAYDKIYDIKVIGKILSWGFWATLVPVFATITIFKYRRNDNKVHSIVVVIPLLLSIIVGLWFSPMITGSLEGIRYLYPVVYTIPLTILWCFYCVKNNKERQE